MEKTFFLKTSSELCRRTPLLRGVNSYMARLGSAWDSVPGPLKLLILLPHTRGAHHSSSFRMDPAVLLHCSIPGNGSWPQDNHPQCSPTSSTCVQTKTLAPHQVEQKQTLQYLQGLSAALFPKKKTSLDHQQAHHRLGVGVPRVPALHPPSSSPGAAVQGWWHSSPPGSCW